MIVYVLGTLLTNLDPAWIALIGTVLGGVGLKAVEHWLNKSKVKIDDATQIRGELRAEITALRAEVTHAEQQADKWRKEYYDLRDKMTDIMTQLQIEKSRHDEE